MMKTPRCFLRCEHGNKQYVCQDPGCQSMGIVDTEYHWKSEHSYSMRKAYPEARTNPLYMEKTTTEANLDTELVVEGVIDESFVNLIDSSMNSDNVDNIECIGDNIDSDNIEPKEDSKLKKNPSKKDALLHEGFFCNVCNSTISGYRYTCVQCPDYDLCGSCEARGAHCLHYVLRIPRPKPYGEIKSLLDSVRSSLILLNWAPEQVDVLDINDIKSEINYEEDVLSDPFLDDNDNTENNSPETVESEHIPGDPLIDGIVTIEFVEASANNENIRLDNPNKPKVAESQHQITNTMNLKPIILKSRNDEIPPPASSLHKPEEPIKTDNKSAELVETIFHRDSTSPPRDRHNLATPQTDYKRLLNTCKPTNIKVISKQGTDGRKSATDRVIHVFTVAKGLKKEKKLQQGRVRLLNGTRLSKEEIKAVMKYVR